MILIYCRVSTPEQARDNAVSIPEQLRKGHAIAQLRGVGKFDAVEYRDEGVSGAIPFTQRPAGKQLWDDAKAGDIIVAAKLDRLFRSSSDALTMMERFNERKIKVILIDVSVEPVAESATAKLFFTMLAAFADFERQTINQRTSEGRVGKRSKGGFMGGAAPYGYRIAGKGRDAVLIDDPAEQEVVGLVLKRFDQGKTAARIINELAMRGYRARDDKMFGYMQVLRIRDRVVDKVEQAA
jgi:DNA invertase Pin-like site-specific DNA recombinase